MAAKPRARRKPRTERPSASEIAPGVFVGGWKDAVGFDGARFCVLDEMPAETPADAGVTIYDGERDVPILSNLDRVAKLVEEAHADHRPVLVFCGHGVRRSPLAAAWYLHRSEGLPIDEAYRRIQAARPQVEHAREWIGHWEILTDAPSTTRPSKGHS